MDASQPQWQLVWSVCHELVYCNTGSHHFCRVRSICRYRLLEGCLDPKFIYPLQSMPLEETHCQQPQNAPNIHQLTKLTRAAPIIPHNLPKLPLQKFLACVFNSQLNPYIRNIMIFEGRAEGEVVAGNGGWGMRVDGVVGELEDGVVGGVGEVEYTQSDDILLDNKLLQMQGQKQLLERPQLLISSIVGCLDQLLEESPQRLDETSVFNLKTAPTISVADYLARMVKYMNASVSVYIYALVLLDRAQEYNQNFRIHSKNVHRLLLASNLVAVKYLDDLFYKNSFYASVGGVTLKVLNQLEQQFLHLINFNCQVDSRTLDSYLERLQLFTQLNARQQTQKENATLPNQKPTLLDKRELPCKPKLQELGSEESGVGQRGVRGLNCQAECK